MIFKGKTHLVNVFRPLLSMKESEQRLVDHRKTNQDTLEFCKKSTTACIESLLFAGKYTLPSNTKLDNLTRLLQCSV